MNNLDSSIINNKCQLYGLVTLRVLIGWHFLYEGISKIINFTGGGLVFKIGGEIKI